MALVKYNDNSISAVTSTALAEGDLIPIKTLTASGSASLSFVHGSDGVVLDSTYPIYKFEFIDIHPATNQASFQINFRDGGSSYDATKTTTLFEAYHYESGSSNLRYDANNFDLAQSTSPQSISTFLSNDNDASATGIIHLYNPSSTTFVKHFIISTQSSHGGGGSASMNQYIGGYCNTTNVIDGVQFAMSSGNIDSGKIKLYGIKDS